MKPDFMKIKDSENLLRQSLNQRILVLDGAMGTMIPVSYTHLTLPTKA